MVIKFPYQHRTIQRVDNTEGVVYTNYYMAGVHL